MKKLLSSVLTCAIAGSLLVAPAANATDYEEEILLRTSASVRGIYDPNTNRWICASSEDYTSLTHDSRASLLSIGRCTHPEYTVLLNTVFEHLEETIDQVDHLADKVDRLEEKIQADEREIDHLHKNLSISRNELDATKRENRELNTKIDQSQKKIEELKEKNLLTEDELDKVTAKLNAAEAKIKELTHKVQKLEKEVKELKERNAELQKESHDLLSKIDSLNTKNASLHKDLNASFGLNVFFGVISAIAAIIGIGHFLKPVFEKFFHRR
ncbi:hypothetical protein CpMEX2_03670 [Corynebacterium pseudotuberculosis]|uniref:coiled-coil domain-containing protein n=1 Tax=Corynebacterium pseudotuberculosis TaxID=1719 RepID=UPI0006BB98FC|nr:hypothetical protein [Corynebacterium pseudotuberculosis]ALF57262.1 hypothetical protein AN902_03620 [Corynebacterium pseudotuberculosis]ANH25548.1 Hypothetical protein CpMEX9_0750 [Corynebacterium pseudotuberculosis]APZ31502.1 Hypothetical protein CpMEX1_0746 [Corynebacterium pseudotuberculosis]QGX58844.1 hypothetical protein CpMEX2_03670 [Corynebacterium pseudotuberculosis]